MTGEERRTLNSKAGGAAAEILVQRTGKKTAERKGGGYMFWNNFSLKT